MSIDAPDVSLDARAWCAPRSRRSRPERFPDVRFRPVPRAPSWSFRFGSRGRLIGSLNGAPQLRCVPLRRRRSSFSKPSPIRQSSPSKTSGCSKNSRSRWNSRRRRVKSWASSPAHRRTFNRCWIPWQRMRRGCVRPMTRRSCGSRGMSFCRAASYGSRRNRLRIRPLTREIVGGRAVIDRQTVHVHDIRCGRGPRISRVCSVVALARVVRLLAVPLLREGVSIGAIMIRRYRGPPVFRQADQTAQKPSPTKQSSP